MFVEFIRHAIRGLEPALMHEMSIVSGIFDSVGEKAEQAGAKKVTAIDLKIGEMTDVVDEALDFAFQALSEGTIFEGCELRVEKVPPKSLCFDCGNEFEHDRFNRVCKECGSLKTKIIEGKELEIVSIEVDLPD